MLIPVATIDISVFLIYSPIFSAVIQLANPTGYSQLISFILFTFSLSALAPVAFQLVVIISKYFLACDTAYSYSSGFNGLWCLKSSHQKYNQSHHLSSWIFRTSSASFSSQSSSQSIHGIFALSVHIPSIGVSYIFFIIWKIVLGLRCSAFRIALWYGYFSFILLIASNQITGGTKWVTTATPCAPFLIAISAPSSAWEIDWECNATIKLWSSGNSFLNWFIIS